MLTKFSNKKTIFPLKLFLYIHNIYLCNFKREKKMGEYTVRQGENLWNICKKQFNLSSNREIANKVNEIAAANGITNPNKIQIGQKIKIDFSKATEEQKQYSQEVNQAVANKIDLNNIQTYADIQRLENSSVSIFGTNTIAQGKQNEAYTDYSEKLLLEYYDIDKDGKVTAEEFAQKEQQGSEKANELTLDKIADDTRAMGAEPVELTEEEMQQYKAISQRSANLFAQNLDFNGNGQIDAQELAFFNKTADGIDGKEDGVITAAAESAMFQSVTGMNAENKEYNAVINKYLQGQTLTADEQKILEESQQAIRTSMRKASGLNFEG